MSTTNTLKKNTPSSSTVNRVVNTGNTRSRTPAPSGTPENIDRDQGQDELNLVQAEHAIRKRQLIPGTMPISLAAIVHALAFLSEGKDAGYPDVSNTVRGTLKALAVLLNEEIYKKNHEELITDLSEKVRSMVDEATEELKSMIKKTADAVQLMASKEADVSPTYKDMLTRAPLPPRPDEVRLAQVRETSRVLNRQRQIIIDSADNSIASDFSGLTEAQIIGKVGLAVEQMETTGKDLPTDPRPTHFEFVSVRKLRNGGTLLETKNTEMATWVAKVSYNRQRFLTALGANSVIKTRTFPYIVQYVPITFNPDATDMRSVERLNDLPTGLIQSARWFKPVNLRREGPDPQKTAHLALNLTDQERGDQMEAGGGIILQGMRLNVKRVEKDPLRCLKCQLYGHFAKNCKLTRDVCATCGGDHRSKNCVMTNKQHCASCESDFHASWSRDCPEFIRRKRSLGISFPENNIRLGIYDSNAAATRASMALETEEQAVRETLYPQFETPNNSAWDTTPWGHRHNSPSSEGPSRSFPIPFQIPPRPDSQMSNISLGSQGPRNTQSQLTSFIKPKATTQRNTRKINGTQGAASNPRKPPTIKNPGKSASQGVPK